MLNSNGYNQYRWFCPRIRSCYYAVISNCQRGCEDGPCADDIDLRYSIILKNGGIGGKDDGHLSCDEDGMHIGSSVFLYI